MIHDFTELVTEAQRITGIADLAQRADMIVGFAETYLNEKLRLQSQEQCYEFPTDANGEAVFPPTAANVRNVYLCDRVLPRLTQEAVITSNGRLRGWSVRGDRFISTEPETDLVMWYYQQLPPIATFDSNDVLASNPEVYLNAVVWKAYMDAGDYDRGARTESYLRELIDMMNRQDESLRIGQIKLNSRPTP